MDFQAYKYSKEASSEFITTLRARVNDYFKQNNISKYGNGVMVRKSIAMLLMYFLPYGLMLSGIITNYFIFYLLWILMGIGMAGIGLSIMHDANHGAYSKYKMVNKLMGTLINLVGGYTTNWKIQHNRLHHTYTNVEGADEDIKSTSILRFSPHQKYMKIHRFQFIYAWFFYTLMTIYWSTFKDFSQLARYKRMGFIQKPEFRKEMSKLIFWKLFYYLYVFILPLVLLSVPVWLLLVSYISMHLLAGFILSSIFQTAHVMPSSEFPVPDETGHLENNWAVHQLKTTANYAPKSKIFSWYVGGLNFQVEHHLFPTICHVHYKKISKIVQETAREYGLPYNYQKNFVIALKEHLLMLKKLGNPAFTA